MHSPPVLFFFAFYSVLRLYILLKRFLTKLGHYARHEHHIGASSHVLSQLWKEYSLSDSRYLTRDAFLVCMESVTALCWGPLSFLCAYAVVAGADWRHPIQSIISLGQIYGDVLYYGTCTYEFLVYGREFSRPEPYYFIGYYVFLNAFWIVIPSVLLLSSARATSKAFAVVRRLQADGKKQ